VPFSFRRRKEKESVKYLKIGILCLALPLCFWGVLSAADQDNNANAALVRDLEDHLIAPCCWTQPISEHDSAIAEEMRDQVRTMVARGMGREAILDYFVAQYGERILAEPRPEGFNRLVYILPWVALIAGAAIVLVLLKKFRAPAPAPAPDAGAAAIQQPQPDSRYLSVIEKELKDLEQ
jgi:cytochrome c-type biogenesis protein CcmH